MIEDFKDRHKGETAVVIGNGPSLERTPLADLCAKYCAFGANKIYGLGFHPLYWTCVDMNMIHDCVPYVLEHFERFQNCFVPRDIPLPGAHQLNVVIESGFSMSAAEKVVIGGTVTYVNLQLAFYMGFETVLLVGVDHKYPKAASRGKPGHKMIAAGDDPDHFKMADGSPYFTPGRLYNRPELSATERYYAQARSAYTRAGRKIVNLTPDSALDVFEKQSWSKWV